MNARDFDWIDVALDRKVPVCQSCGSPNLRNDHMRFAYVCDDCQFLTACESAPTKYRYELEGR